MINTELNTQLIRQEVQPLAIPNRIFATNGDLILQLKDGPIIEIFPADIVNAIRHMITQEHYKKSLPKRLSVVSALQEEGVTYVSRVLATSLAHDTGRSVCLVDLNWWAPNPISMQLLDHNPGITDVIYNGTNIQNALLPTTNPFLSILLAGGVDPRQRPILARSAELERLLVLLSERFDHIIMDIPAVKSSSDAIALASLGESCCAVVRQGVTSSTVVGQMLSELDHIPIMGVLLNRVDSKIPNWIERLVPQD